MNPAPGGHYQKSAEGFDSQRNLVNLNFVNLLVIKQTEAGENVFLCFYSNISAIVAVNLLPLAANSDSPAPQIQPQASNGRQQSSNTKNRLFEHHKHKRNLCIGTRFSLKTTLIIRSHANPSRNRDGGVWFLLFLQSKHFK